MPKLSQVNVLNFLGCHLILSKYYQNSAKCNFQIIKIRIFYVYSWIINHCLLDNELPWQVIIVAAVDMHGLYYRMHINLLHSITHTAVLSKPRHLFTLVHSTTRCARISVFASQHSKLSSTLNRCQTHWTMIMEVLAYIWQNHVISNVILKWL